MSAAADLCLRCRRRRLVLVVGPTGKQMRSRFSPYSYCRMTEIEETSVLLPDQLNSI